MFCPFDTPSDQPISRRGFVRTELAAIHSLDLNVMQAFNRK